MIKFKTKKGTLIEFTSSTSSNPPGYSRGEAVDVLYLETKPEKARINGFFSLWGGSIILGVMGFIFFIIGISIIFTGKFKKNTIQHLQQNGTPVLANFQSVERNTSYSVNGRNPYQIVCQWKNPTTGEIHIFKSENLWFDPIDHITVNEMTVLNEKDNPKNIMLILHFYRKLQTRFKLEKSKWNLLFHYL